MSENSRLKRTVFLCSLDAFLTGLLFAFAIFLALLSEPSMLVGVLTNLVVHIPWDNRALGFPVAVTMFLIAIWRSRRIYRSKVITKARQFSLNFSAFALILLKFFIFILALDREMRKLW